MPRCTQILKSVAKTINLAKPNVYQIPRKPPLNSLVFEKLPEPKCGDRITTLRVTAKPLRTCTKEELQAMYCCPRPCDCELKTRISGRQRLAKALLLVAKNMIVGALVYFTWAEVNILKIAAKVILIKAIIQWTWKEGLWSDSFHTSCFLGKFIEYCPQEKKDEENEYLSSDAPIIIPDKEPCHPYIPRYDVVSYHLMVFWNKTVQTFFWIILNGPSEFAAFLMDLFTRKQEPVYVDPCDIIRKQKRN